MTETTAALRGDKPDIYRDQRFDATTPLGGRLAFTDALHRNGSLLADKSLYKFVWVESGRITLSIDHIDTHLDRAEAVTLSPLQRFGFTEVAGAYRALLFNSNFYCIFGHDDEVSCNGLLFNGTSQIPRFKLGAGDLVRLDEATGAMLEEWGLNDRYRDEMLRIQLKRIIILFSRLIRRRFEPAQDKEQAYETVRQFYILVDAHFRENKLVQDYAAMLNRSPKTLANLFATCGLPSPLSVIHQRLIAEAKRLLLYTPKSGKEIGLLLGFEDQSAFSRFFRRMTAQSVTQFRKSAARGNN